jgi:hypothetical protein
MKYSIRPERWFVAALILAALCVPAAAQQGNTDPPGSPSARGTRPDRDQATRQVMRDLETARRVWDIKIEEARRPVEQQQIDRRLVFAQISEDFLRIQVVNDELAQALSPTGPLDLKYVAQATSEIKKRAGRLKFNLALPEPEERAKRPKVEVLTDEQVRAALAALGPLIDGFAHNPIFKASKVLDAQMSIKAGTDLEEIIELSGQLKKGIERLNKAPAKAP